MNEAIDFLKGKKTYITLAFGAVVVVANHFFGPLPGVSLDPDGWTTQLYTLLLGSFTRAAIAKGQVKK